ncbi:MAG: spore germination protein, partial [Firmicutes bacterium]|nr:spore germination protein [Bacillota bacterium]
PPMLETLFVLILFEIINEASFRMPRYVGMAMSIVGALVLGDTAVKAGLISSPSIMIVAVSSISLYTLPDQVGAFRLLRIVYVLLAGLSGFFGMALFFLASLCYLCGLDSYGTPYFAPFAPKIKPDLKDGLMRRGLTDNLHRPVSIPNVNRTRQKK